MLDYKTNRLDYGRQLNPPSGFVMQRAVATTYSLDLSAFLSIPVALFYQRNLDGKVSEDRMDIFDAIQKTSDTITIYCQKGKIKVPESSNRIVSFIEDSVAEVLPADAHTSFHPKIWIIRYKNKAGDVLYRLIVLSRNLTFDRSWDVAFSMEGFVSTRKNARSRPLADFVKHLTTYRDFNESRKFIDDLGRVDFEIDDPFTKFLFHPIGFNDYQNPLNKETWQDLVIVSPFLDRSAIEEISRTISGRKFLLSRKEELDKIHWDALRGFTKVYAFSNLIVEGEEYTNVQEDPDDTPLKQNIHAKLFIGLSSNDTMKWFLGSANCSTPAFRRNQEFLIELIDSGMVCSVDQIMETMLRKEQDIEFFSEYYRSEEVPVDSDEHDFRQTIYHLLRYLETPANVEITCSRGEEASNKYNIGVFLHPHTAFNQHDLQFFMAPYGWKGDLAPVRTQDVIPFKGIAIHHLSPFFIWKVVHPEKNQEKQFITRLKVNLPPLRKEAIFKSIIQDKERFIQFIQFLLGANDDHLFFHGSQQKPASRQADKSWINMSAPMYEEMLIAAARNPDKLRDIEKLIQRLKKHKAENVIPDDFNMIWNVFKKMLPDD